jgi:hypothetical protein
MGPEGQKPQILKIPGATPSKGFGTPSYGLWMAFFLSYPMAKWTDRKYRLYILEMAVYLVIIALVIVVFLITQK